MTNENKDAQLKFLSFLPKKLTAKHEQFDPTIGIDYNLPKIRKLLFNGNAKYCQFKKKHYFNSYYNCNDTKCKLSKTRNKVKNEEKFGYFHNICKEMDINFNEFVDKICYSIKNAFEFAKKNPNLILTQAYINEYSLNITYELVLLGEIKHIHYIKSQSFKLI